MMKQLFSQYLRLFLPIFLLLLSGQIGMQVEAQQLFAGTIDKLFVFGDSYVDGGNTPKWMTDAWKVPHGQAFPGVPSGRFSDGRVLSDYIASHLGLPPPVPSVSRNDLPPNELQYGMNFAYGGTGVFDTIVIEFPNMTVQIDLLQELIEQNVYNDLSNSMATLSAFGNDYIYYLYKNGPDPSKLWPYIWGLVNQMRINLVRVQSLGVKKIVVTSVPPFGCIPLMTGETNLRAGCKIGLNAVAIEHNRLLKLAVNRLNREATDGTTFLFLNVYESFMSVIRNPSENNLVNVYSPCCVGHKKDENTTYTCGTVGANNEPLYTLCENPESTLFWDVYHPGQAGWEAIFNNLDKGGLGQLPLSSIII